MRLAALTLALAGPAAAQDFTGWIGGGTILPAGTVRTKYETGWYATAGVGRRLDDRLSLRFDYGLSQQRLVAHALEGAFVDGGHDVHAFELSLRYTWTPGGPPRSTSSAAPSSTGRRRRSPRCATTCRAPPCATRG
ncbi:MAG: hypothetical protein M0C28_36895 [Candidatus Moduliflexus flocculans]|nr:hypothetical protein [Candidatus Moduliflexus flocculans]